MELVTSAIVSALGTDLIKSSVKDAYEGVKAVIRRKWGESGPVKAIAALEKDPKSAALAGVVKQEILAAKANMDADVRAALRLLLREMKALRTGSSSKIQVNVNGGVVQGIAGAGKVEVGSMTFGAPPKR
jgi:translation initiation factor 2 gamma subunit (eIF-2gamma)